MTMDAAMAPGNLLCYEMNGQPLPVEHGFPVRLIAPGWYGVANVKWLKRIELIDHRFAGRFMARDYVTFRERTDAAGNTTWTFQTVGPYRLKSAPAKVTRRVQGNSSKYRVIGVAWGGSIARVEVSIDGGPWRQANVVQPGLAWRPVAGLAWNFWTYDWGQAPSGRHTVASRAIDTRRSGTAGAGRPDHHQPAHLLGGQPADHPHDRHPLILRGGDRESQTLHRLRDEGSQVGNSRLPADGLRHGLLPPLPAVRQGGPQRSLVGGVDPEVAFPRVKHKTLVGAERPRPVLTSANRHDRQWQQRAVAYAPGPGAPGGLSFRLESGTPDRHGCLVSRQRAPISPRGTGREQRRSQEHRTASQARQPPRGQATNDA